MPRLLYALFVVLIAGCANAAAQPPTPIGPFVVDARGTLARFKGDAAVASALSVDAADMPTRGLGLATGLHWYPVRGRGITLGVGGELVIARDSKTKQATGTSVSGPTITTRFSMISPHVSLNFGKGDGWSYISGGLGRARLTAGRDDAAPGDSAARTRATHYGGGARWFTGPHLAFTFDLRFYTINAREASGTVAGYPRARMTVISAGVSLR
jgi:hypothetical protein